jgi:hypothetical protein
MTARDMAAWIERHELTMAQADAALGLVSRTLFFYRNGRKIPRTAELLRAAYEFEMGA